MPAGRQHRARRRAHHAAAEPDRPPTAIFSANTRCSLGVVPVLHRRGRLDIALVAFGDFPMADSVTPAVTVIDHSPEIIGRLAAERLMQRLEGEIGRRRDRRLAPLHRGAAGHRGLRPEVRP